MSERVNAKLYKIQDLIVEEKSDSDALIRIMLDAYSQKSGNHFIEIQLRTDLYNDEYNSKLFVFSTPQKIPEWYEFLTSIVLNKMGLDNLKAKYSSFILFIYDNNRIYAVTKGYHGHHLLEEYIDKFFGLEVLSRLVDKSVTEIKQIEERGVFGVEIGAQRFFRDNYNLSYEDDFGKIYKTMLASISEENFEKIGIIKKRAEVSKISAYGSASFEVSTNFDYQELLDRINKIEVLLKTKGVQFNQFYHLTTSELSTIKTDLNNEILNMAYDAYLNKETIDFYHPDVLNYLRSIRVRFNVAGDSLEIPLGASLSYLDVIDKLIENDKIDCSDKNSFIKSLKNCYGSYIIDEGSDYSNDVSLEKWIGGEVELNGHKFFKIDNEWYKYKEGFDNYLNKYFAEFDFDNISPDHKLLPWNLKKMPTERDYNKSFKDQENFITGDTAFLDNIELCDLVRISNDKIYLYHIKKGLGRDLRVLSNQIINASRSITNALNENDDVSLKRYYNEISKKNYDNGNIKFLKEEGTIFLSQKDFIREFKSKNIAFVFAYSSKSTKKINEEIISTNSRIAKLSLIYCMRDMRRVNYEFLIERIKEV